MSPHQALCNFSFPVPPKTVLFSVMVMPIKTPPPFFPPFFVRPRPFYLASCALFFFFFRIFFIFGCLGM